MRDQRFYAGTYGRFITPDPYQSGSGSGTPGDPGSWNRYAYVEGDPDKLRRSTRLYLQRHLTTRTRVFQVPVLSDR